MSATTALVGSLESRLSWSRVTAPCSQASFSVHPAAQTLCDWQTCIKDSRLKWGPGLNPKGSTPSMFYSHLRFPCFSCLYTSSTSICPFTSGADGT